MSSDDLDYVEIENSKYIPEKMRDRGGNVDWSEYTIKLEDPKRTEIYDFSAYWQGYVESGTPYAEVQGNETRATEIISSHRFLIYGLIRNNKK